MFTTSPGCSAAKLMRPSPTEVTIGSCLGVLARAAILQPCCNWVRAMDSSAGWGIRSRVPVGNSCTDAGPNTGSAVRAAMSTGRRSSNTTYVLSPLWNAAAPVVLSNGTRKAVPSISFGSLVRRALSPTGPSFSGSTSRPGGVGSVNSPAPGGGACGAAGGGDSGRASTGTGAAGVGAAGTGAETTVDRPPSSGDDAIESEGCGRGSRSGLLGPGVAVAPPSSTMSRMTRPPTREERSRAPGRSFRSMVEPSMVIPTTFRGRGGGAPRVILFWRCTTTWSPSCSRVYSVVALVSITMRPKPGWSADRTAVPVAGVAAPAGGPPPPNVARTAMAANARDALVKLIRNLPAAYRYPTDPSHVREVAGHSAGRRRWRRGFRLAPQVRFLGQRCR